MTKFLLTVALAIGAMSVQAQKGWYDVTDQYIMNPSYVGNNYAYWEGDGLSGNGPMENAEHYSRTFDTYQRISGLTPNTKYRLSLNAFYRYGSTSNDYNTYASGNYEDYQYAQLYVTTAQNVNYQVGLQLLGSGARTSSLGGATSTVSVNTGGGGMWGGRTYYMPNNMLAAYYWFEAGYYKNSLEFTADGDGSAQIGIRKYTYVNEDWVCLDDWKLEYYGELIKVSSVTMNKSSLSLIPSEEQQLSVSIAPANAVYKGVTWKSSNTKVATVDETGLVTAVAAGTCTITATAVDGSNKSASCAITVTNSTTTVDKLLVNELQASNIDMFLDPAFNYGSWIELYNPENSAVNLSELYITDDPSNLKMHRMPKSIGVVPAKGYKVLWFDHNDIWNIGEVNQIPFKLNYNGGTIIISDGDRILLQQDYPQAICRTSYARTTDGGSSWATTSNPTPGETNTGSTFANVQTADPVISVGGRRFSGSMTFNVTVPSGSTLIYTEDGSTPTLDNGTKKTGQSVVNFSINQSKVYRFRTYKNGELLSNVVTRSYIKDDNYDSPIISVVTNRDNLYSAATGLFMQGPNGRPGRGQTSNCNWNMEWDRPVNFEYITENGEYALSQEADMSMCGGWTRAYTPHSFKLKAAKYYMGQNSFDYQFFEEKPYNKHKVLQIRNGGNNTGGRIKDAALQEIARTSGIQIESQCWKPTRVYLNGSFYAVLNMREPNNKDYAYGNYGIDTDDMDVFEISSDSGYVQMRGTKEKFLEWYNLSSNASDAGTYKQICDLVDIDEYINYMAIEFYLGSDDWPRNNVKAFRDRNDGKFRFVMFDVDAAFAYGTNVFNQFMSKQWWTYDTLHGVDAFGNSIEGQHVYAEGELVTIFENMMKNSEFRKKFIDTYCLVGGSVYEPSRSRVIIDNMIAKHAKAGHSSSGEGNNVYNSLASRNSSMIPALKNWGNAGITSNAVTAKFGSNIDGAQIRYNDIVVPTGKFNGRLYLPVTLKAEEKAGYRFVGWKDNTGTAGSSPSSQTIIANGSNWKYYDSGSLDGVAWTATNYNESGWQSGATPIGYDSRNSKSFSTETEQFLTTYYLRRKITYPGTPDAGDAVQFTVTYDDGFIMYVNGQEVKRVAMPDGAVNSETMAVTYAINNPNTEVFTVPASAFKSGENVIAVELHNYHTSSLSTDIYWDASMAVSSNDGGGEEGIVCYTPEYQLSSSSNIDVTAVYEPEEESILLANGTTPIKVNEVSAANTMYVNDAFKKNDWIELYNTTDEDIDVAGMYLSDNLSKPQKFQIPSYDSSVNTVVPAHGFLVVWADKLDAISQVHATFKLAAEGGDILLTSEDGEWCDTLSYPEHTGQMSVGLFPDGGSQVYVMNTPTIGKSNLVSSYAEMFEEPHPLPEPEPDPEPEPEPTIDGDIAEGTYYIQNVATGLYLVGGQDWGTRAVVGEHAIDFDAKLVAKDTYNLDSKIANGDALHYLSTDIEPYVDSAPGSIVIKNQGNGTFSIANGTSYLRVDENNRTRFDAFNAADASAQWRFLTLQDMMAVLNDATTDKPADATFLIKDPDFGRNDTRFGAAWSEKDTPNLGGDASNMNAEHWGATVQTFTTQQTISLPNGWYVLSCDGFYRYNNTTENTNDVAIAAHENGTEKIYSYLFANNEMLPLRSIAYTNAATALESLPFTQNDASAAFSKGLYQNYMLVEVTGGILTFGVKKTNHEGTDWTVFDNFELLYYGQNKPSVEPEEPDAIVDVEASIVKTEYYTMDGIAVKNPRHLPKGVYVRAQVMSDGKVRTSKILVK